MRRKYGEAVLEAASRYKSSIDSVSAVVCIYFAILIGLLNFAQAWGSRLGTAATVIDKYVVSAAWSGNPTAHILFGAFFLFLAYQLWLKKRAALLILSAVFVIAGSVDVLNGRGVLPGALGCFIGLLFLVAASRFPGRPDPAALRRFKIALPVFLAVIVGYGTIGLYLVKVPGINPSLYELTWKAVLLSLGEGASRFYGWAAVFRSTLNVLAAFGFVYLTVLLFRPYRETSGRNRADEARARGLLERFGSDSLSYFNTRRGKSYFFHSGEAFLAYRRVGDFALITGDPVGPAGLITSTVREFAEFASERGWRLAVIGARHQHAEAYESCGLENLVMGEEPLIDLRGFSLEGRKVRKLRQSVGKLHRSGHTMEFMLNSSVPAHLRHSLRQISSDWKGGKPETGFSMGLGRMLSPEDPDCLLSIAYDPESNPVGFLYLVPMYPHQGYSLDVTRTVPGASNSLSEFMLASTASFLKENGYRYLSLHFIAFSQHFREDSDEPGNACGRAMARALDYIVPVTSLYRFDRKFHPGWLKRCVIYQGPVDLPFIALAALWAESVLKLAKPADRKTRERARSGELER
ncbi:MAG: bifunctional lysylphosphatidylglycerol flippase/synthetase MprF [Candidatus Geothermincolia bacterium]